MRGFSNSANGRLCCRQSAPICIYAYMQMKNMISILKMGHVRPWLTRGCSGLHFGIGCCLHSWGEAKRCQQSHCSESVMPLGFGGSSALLDSVSLLSWDKTSFRTLKTQKSTQDGQILKQPVNGDKGTRPMSNVMMTDILPFQKTKPNDPSQVTATNFSSYKPQLGASALR